MIQAEALTKRYGYHGRRGSPQVEVRPGVVTGFLGPSGEGKTPTMRLILGLDAALLGDPSI